jgi:hypothetical protein
MMSHNLPETKRRAASTLSARQRFGRDVHVPVGSFSGGRSAKRSAQ